MSNSYDLCPTHLSREGENILGGFAPCARLVTGVIGSVFRCLVLTQKNL